MDINILNKKSILVIVVLVVAIVLLYAGGASSLFSGDKDSGYYTMEDYKKVEKIDAHMHMYTKKPEFLRKTKKENFRLVTINTDMGMSITEQRDIALDQINDFPGQISFATTFSIKGKENPDWKKHTITYLDESFKKGAVAVKIWKNIGMSVKDTIGNFLMIDNPMFKPIFDFLVEHNKPVVFHIAEPKNCWLPLEEMTVKGDWDYFVIHPEYHMYLHPEYPSYEKLINARDNAIAQNPELKFVACHLASLEWDVDELAQRLDKFPNMAADMAGRICHLQFQSKKDREKVRDFIIKYADKLLYGTDISVKDDYKFDTAHNVWLEDWRYFVTDDIMTSPDFEGEFRALKLPKNVIDKIFRNNAQKWYPDL